MRKAFRSLREAPLYLQMTLAFLLFLFNMMLFLVFGFGYVFEVILKQVRIIMSTLELIHETVANIYFPLSQQNVKLKVTAQTCTRQQRRDDFHLKSR